MWSLDLCDWIVVAGGPAVQRRGKGSRLTDWVEELHFFFRFFFFSQGRRSGIWGGPPDGRTTDGRTLAGHAMDLCCFCLLVKYQFLMHSKK
jgi:hypothetical protein